MNEAALLHFDPQLAISVPATHALLESSHLTLHPLVSSVVLHGSRGLAGGYRPGSDIDLTLIVDVPQDTAVSELQVLLRAVAELTLKHWTGSVEPDLAVVFDTQRCGLKCFRQNAWDERLCTIGGVDCFGIFKIQKGFDGFITNAGVQVKRMHPCLQIWHRSGQ